VFEVNINTQIWTVMKKFILLSTFIFVIIASAMTQSSITENVFRESVNRKVLRMQQSIGFDEQKAERLKVLELNYLLDVQKAETCFLCNSKKKIEKLKNKRDEDLQRVLSRDEYIKYLSIENNLINENNRLWLK
jgi:hypothetical protein